MKESERFVPDELPVTGSDRPLAKKNSDFFVENAFYYCVSDGERHKVML